MRSLLLSLLLLFCYSYKAICQERSTYHITILSDDEVAVSRTANGTLQIQNVSNKEAKIFKEYKIYELQKAYPWATQDQLKNIYKIVVENPETITQLQDKFPDKYLNAVLQTVRENVYYPNDYGATSPVKNQGNSYPSFDLDMIEAPAAWAITTGSPEVIIGISDSKIDSLDPDFENRIQKHLSYSIASGGMLCAHGSNVAAIAIAKMDNQWGRAGLCSDCGVVTNAYGSFKHIEELVAAGAKVINTSWAMCSMEKNYHPQIKQRLQEYYDDGIIIVAGAGNGTDCNRDGNKLGDSLYPASFKRVLSVSGVFVTNSFINNETWINKNNNRKMTRRLKDRSRAHFYVNSPTDLEPEVLDLGMQLNPAVDLMAPSEAYLLGHEACGLENPYGGATSAAAPYVTGVIGLMWSANYCLSAYEVETILKLTAQDIEHLPGNIPYKGMLGAGRLNAYRAVHMAQELQNPESTIYIENRNFNRFEFNIHSAPNALVIKNQSFTDEATVAFKAKNAITLKAGTHLKPNKKGKTHLQIAPEIAVRKCEKKPPKKYIPYREIQVNK